MIWKGDRQPLPQERLLVYVGVKVNAQGTLKFSITVLNSFLETLDWIDISSMLFLPRGPRVTGVLGLVVGAYQSEKPQLSRRPISLLPSGIIITGALKSP